MTAHALPAINDVALPTIAYDDARCIDDVHEAIRQAREQGPFALGPLGPEVLTYDLVRTVLRDSRFAMPRGLALAVQGITSGPAWDRACRLIVSMDGAEHRRLRRLVSRAFTPRAAERLRQASSDVIIELVAKQREAGRCDIVADIARSYPVPIICALLGAPRSDWQLFSRWADQIGHVFGGEVAQHTTAILTAWDEFDEYLNDLIARRRHDLSDDVISDLIRAEDEGDRLTHEELISLALILLNGGTDTTRNQLAAAVQAFCDHPDQWDLLARHAELAPRAVEEVMRHSPVILKTLRIAVEDVPLGGIVIPSGTPLFANTAAANRDPAWYDRPECLDITRDAAPAMLTFGGGSHFCLGAHLARVELAEALTVMTQMLSRPRLAADAPWKPISGISGPRRLIVDYTSRPSPG
ncbi:cytochrome [Mycobacterium florentinum]|uniref:Cytochrome n=1 Tax=Mycobacterium florentinum TaxID=292462 RepID=A0A1X1U030_MYCFL|nr:cytochrome P450 [Mycobacterium florentinum]MCV7413274.1 cytochrome P450 [Mycobacterium florentinum]ORV50167.1 cytochrome [Mycobacterium florentinum]BBX76802.1 cytochrome P450 hydroxylase [Mycobacterium florentinum]